MPKKDKKNAKESSGIAAAVTKQTTGKFSNNGGNTNSNAAAAAADNDSAVQSKSRSTSGGSTPPIDTPEFKPSLPPDNVNSHPSPMLDALSNASVSASTAPSMTTEWARAGALAGSPGNLISLMGDSPPTQPSSYEDASGRLSHHAWAAHRPFMSPSPASVSVSPPVHARRPLSYQMDQQHHGQSPDSLPQFTSPAGYRRSSLHSQGAYARSVAQPPLPHHPQPHFYGAPDIDLSLTPQSGMRAGDRGYYFGFDRLPSSPDNPGASGNVAIAGYEGGLDVYAVSKKGLEPVAGLKGLHGGVFHAKILPWTVTGTLSDMFPLVAVVLHGPVLPSETPASPEPSARPSPKIGTGAASPRSAFGQPEHGYHARQSAVDAYQTSVQVYSLKTSKLVDTLLVAPKVPVSAAIALTSSAFQPPPPVGAFTLAADRGTLAVCSGATGECWVFTQLVEAQNAHMFACSGKLWTTLQHSQRAETTDDPGAAPGKAHGPGAPSPRSASTAPIFSLNGRWIAYCPSTPSSQIALGAHIPVPVLGRAPGLAAMTPPHLPAATASVDLIEDSIVNRIMRETTQEFLSGAKWVGQQGLQAWNSYWNKQTSPQAQSQQQQQPTPATQFPPTHGTPGKPAPKEPGLVSIVDVETLASSSSVVPITSFAPPEGCSFLSFSPSSLALFTASSKGDVQNVWDLLRIHHTKSSPLQATISPGDSSGPLVRQLAQFSRMTVTRVVDVAWAEPYGERLAMVTERGTVHLLEMPFSAFMWPPPRRRRPAEGKSADTGTAEAGSSAVSIATGAFGAAYHAAKPFVSRSRRSSAHAPPTTSTIGGGPGAAFKDSAAHGGRVIAAGISSSLGKTGTAINQFRHAGENRVALPSTMLLPAASCVRWVRSRRSYSLFTLGDGLVRIFPNRTRRASVQSKRASRPRRYRDIKVPSLPDDVVAPAIRQIVDLGAQEEVLDLTDGDMDAGNNTLTLHGQRAAPAPDLSVDAAIPQAEIESSAPYQPFHTDRRITLCEYSPANPPDQMASLSAALAETNLEWKPPSSKKKKKQQLAETAPADSAWAFGQDIPSITVDLGIAHNIDDEDLEDPEGQVLPPSAMERVMEYGDQEQIVVTTRRRRGARQGDGDGDGFFEDDCEVLDFADQRV